MGALPERPLVHDGCFLPSLQVRCSSGTIKVVVVDSVTAVVSPLLGGQQREGECCDRARGEGTDPHFLALESGPGPALSLVLCFSSLRLGLDDAAGSRAEDPGPGAQHGGGGEEEAQPVNLVSSYS